MSQSVILDVTPWDIPFQDLHIMRLVSCRVTKFWPLRRWSILLAPGVGSANAFLGNLSSEKGRSSAAVLHAVLRHAAVPHPSPTPTVLPQSRTILKARRARRLPRRRQMQIGSGSFGRLYLAK